MARVENREKEEEDRRCYGKRHETMGERL